MIQASRQIERNTHTHSLTHTHTNTHEHTHTNTLTHAQHAWHFWLGAAACTYTDCSSNEQQGAHVAEDGWRSAHVALLSVNVSYTQKAVPANMRLRAKQGE